jgi:coenzyme F420-0:L-glutamate ligase/coenzyme F420-1:gamma-L-glutamate ligase
VSAPGLSLFALEGIPLISNGDDVGAIIAQALSLSDQKPEDGDVLVLAQKIVSKAEGRAVRLDTVKPSPQACKLAAEVDKDPRVIELILAESQQVIRKKPGVIIVEHRLGYVLANAGIDRSNVQSDENSVLLLPVDPDGSAERIRKILQDRFSIRIGVIIADSVGRAWRLGTTGMALGSAGVVALDNLRGQPDLFGRELEVSEHAVGDAVAAAAELLMGEAAEAMPVVIVRGLGAGHSEQSAAELLRPANEDLFR